MVGEVNDYLGDIIRPRRIIVFRFEARRPPGDLRVDFFATDCLSLRVGVRLEGGDVI